MYNASAFSQTVPLSKTKVSQILENANNTCFTVSFRTGVNAATMKEVLATKSDLTDTRGLAKELLEGEYR